MYIKYDTKKLTEILQDLSILTNISIVFLNPAHELICESKPTDDFCSAYQAQNGKEQCLHSDCILLKKCQTSRHAEYHLCHTGLYDAAMPIIKSGVIVGYLLMGRLRTLDSPTCPQLSDSLTTLYNRIPCLNDIQLSSLCNLLTNILFTNAIEIEYNELAEEISEYIRTHLTDDLSVSVLCKKFFIGRNLLYKCFRDHYNLTVNDYIIEARLDCAKKLLTETSKTVSQVCEAVGIQNEPYFCRLFKKRTGVSPTTYRRNKVDVD